MTAFTPRHQSGRHQPWHHQSGFTLVEMAIVIVIIGLLVGGVLMGQNLIRNADLQRVITDATQYKNTARQFKEKYLELPGDFSGAGAQWGYPGGNIANCPTTAGTGTETCDGNGDGQLAAATAANRYGEMFMFWQHLANEGLIDGKFTGIAGSAVNDAVIGTNVPKSFDRAGWTVYHWGNSPAGGTMFLGAGGPQYGNILVVGKDNGVWYTAAATLTAEEAWNIDTKIDDGKPGRGEIIGYPWASCSTATAATQLDVDYKLTASGEVCALIFANAF